MENMEAFKELMGSSRKIVITIHHNPDADALGSALALASYLMKKNHQVKVVSPNAFPCFLDWMPGSTEVIVYRPETKNLCMQLIQDAEVLFFVDFSTYPRLLDLEDTVKKSASFKVVIDHHLNPTVEADYRIWNPKASSTAELMYDFIGSSGDISLIDRNIGECIYAGYVTDTSSFKYASTTKRIHLITAELMDLGIRSNLIQRLVYDNNSENRIRLLGYALKEKLQIYPEYRTAIIALSGKELAEYGNQLGDTEGLVNYALSLNDIAMAIVIVEQEGYIRMSFRSIGNFAVNEFAQKHFGGGGHKNAAGANHEATLENTEKKIIELLPHYKNELNKDNLFE